MTFFLLFVTSSTTHLPFFQRICQAYELVLGDGRRVWCSPTENRDLFAAQPWCQGTLGFLTCVDLDIVPFRPYLKLTYHNAKSWDEAIDKLEEVTEDSENDIVEGIVYTKSSAVIMGGKFVDRAPPGAKINPVHR